MYCSAGQLPHGCAGVGRLDETGAMGGREELTGADGQAGVMRAWEGVKGPGRGHHEVRVWMQTVGLNLGSHTFQVGPLSLIFLICQMGMISIPGTIVLI